VTFVWEWCEAARHFWKREKLRSGPPASCPSHARARLVEFVDLELWCEPGQHPWRAVRNSATLPTACPEHRSSRPVRVSGDPSTSWLGDLRVCFLLPEGWALRIEVRRPHLDGDGWALPVAVAHALAIGEHDRRRLYPADDRLGAAVTLTRGSGRLTASSIAEPLRHLGALEGDLLFLCLRHDDYSTVHRPRSECVEGDALSALLWRCGLDPRDRDVRDAAWRSLARVLGGTPDGRGEVRRRLRARGDASLLALLDQIERDGLDRGSTAWPEAWQYVNHALADSDVFALTACDGSARVAVGVVDGSGQPHGDLLVTEGRLVWSQTPAGAGLRDVEAVLGREPGKGLEAAAHKPAWVRWLRAEHRARRAALAGDSWQIAVSEGSWRTDAGDYGALLDALESLPPSSGNALAPVQGVRTPYPRSAFAFQRAAEAAAAAQLELIASDPETGFRAGYRGGPERRGAGLLDVLVVHGAGSE
jgi:hypothetical protein